MKQPRLALRIIHFLVSLVVALGILYVSAFGAGPLPPLGSALNVGKGVWTSATDAKPFQNETLHFQGLQRPVTVIFEHNGTAHIRAATDHDLFWTIGYLHARFRLTQMDLERRQGEGQLSEILGMQALDGDRGSNFYGLARTAQAEWQTLPTDSPLHQLLLDYAQGVNAHVTEDEQNGTLPFLFNVLGDQPRPWTPLDSMVVQGDLTEILDLSFTPLMYARMANALGYQPTMHWFPLRPPAVQHRYAQ